jgi:hypothetical protein
LFEVLQEYRSQATTECLLTVSTDVQLINREGQELAESVSTDCKKRMSVVAALTTYTESQGTVTFERFPDLPGGIPK